MQLSFDLHGHTPAHTQAHMCTHAYMSDIEKTILKFFSQLFQDFTAKGLMVMCAAGCLAGVLASHFSTASAQPPWLRPLRLTKGQICLQHEEVRMGLRSQ